MSLYSITEEYLQLLNMEEDIDEQAFKDTLESITDELETKADNIAKIIKELEGDVDTLKKEEERLAKKRKSIENKKSKLKDYLEESMILTGKSKLKTKLFGFTIQKNPPSLDIKAEENIPKNYYIEQQPKLDKKELLKAIKEGLEVEGVELKQSESLRIR